MPIGTPAAEQRIDISLVKALLQDQHPDLANGSVVLMDAGWDNVMYRLGDEFVVRLPRRKAAVACLENEQSCLPMLAERLPITIPVPVRFGRPSNTFPWPWSILRWMPGRTADKEPPAADQAKPLADFLRALHQPAPPSAPPNGFRGVSLGRRAKVVEERLGRLRGVTELITPSLLSLWAEALAAPEASESCWLHGDLHARNVLVESGKITAIIDWGDVTAGDVATDLASVWMLLGDSPARANCLAQYQPSGALLARAKGWAVFFGTVLLDTGLVDHPSHAAMGRATLQRLNADT